MTTDTNPPVADDASELANKVQEAQALLKAETERQRKVDEAKRVLEHYRQAQVASDPQLGPAQDLVKRYAQIAAGVGGIVPSPLDVYGIAAVQLKMIAELAKIFGTQFSENAGKSIIAALTTTAGAGMFAGPVASLIKIVPVLGNVAGAAGLGGAAFVTTYALGKVFTTHFASGGNLLDFDPSVAKQMFGEAMKQGAKPAGAA